MILIDYSGIAISNVIARKLDIEENLIRHMILNSLRLYRRRFNKEYGELVICCDAGNNWRRDTFPQYKAARKDSRSKSDVDWDQLFEITNKIKAELEEVFPYPVIQVDRCEADDIIAKLARETSEFGNYEKCMIVSADKDFIQLQKLPNVSQYSPMAKAMVTTPDAARATFEHVLKGDKGDGVPNVLSADDCFVEGVRQTPLTKPKMQALMENPKSMGEEVEKNIQRNIRMIDLTKTPAYLQFQIINKFEEQRQTRVANKSNVLTYLAENQCKLLIDELGDFINDF